MKINFLRHNCAGMNLIQSWLKQETSTCPFYWKMEGGKSYYGNIHFFTLLGFRMTISTRSRRILKFEQQSVSEKYKDHKIIEINTLEELIEYVKNESEPVIIFEDVLMKENEEKGCRFSLETYDGWRE